MRLRHLAAFGVLFVPAVGAQMGLPAMPAPVEVESWELPEWMTPEDYRPIPGVDWNAVDRQPVKRLRAALILGDFADRDFVVTQPEGSDVLGVNGLHNPIGVGGIPREDVGDFYADFLIRKPSPLNNYQTVNGYWLEDSYGLIGVDATAFGPYRLTGKEHEYGLGGGDAGGAGDACPAGDTCGQDFDTDLILASLQDVTAGIALNGGEDYDFRFLLHAGYDESGVWQEFGEMMFPDRESVPAELGNPDTDKPNFAGTRYIDWTSFAAAEGIWSHALPGVTSTQGESDGGAVFAHELSHIFGVLDNYNNPYSQPPRRSYTGQWANLSRGSFNGPGGSHERWRIPATLGSSMGSHHMLRNKMRLGFMKPNEVLVVPRDTLAVLGPQIATIYPRAYPLFPVTPDIGLHGIHVPMGQDNSPDCNTAEQFDCDGGGYTSYTVEVVDRIGFDSFCPDFGVLIAKNKDAVDLAPFMWAIDAHPEDINTRMAPAGNEGRPIYDYLRPTAVPDGLNWPLQGEPVPIAQGDARQLADALFHAGTGPGIVSEYRDEANGLHFYVLGVTQDARGFRTYRVAVSSTEPSSSLSRGLQVQAGAPVSVNPGRVAEIHFQLTNTGDSVDLVRVAASNAAGWPVQLQHNVLEVPAGETVSVPVYVGVPAGQMADESLDVRFVASSETSALAFGEAATPIRIVGDTTTSARDFTALRGGALSLAWILGLGLLAGLRRRPSF